jgi:hypothetical protein
MTFISQTRQIELLLKRKQLLSLQEAQPGMAIECKQGVIWVTATGDYSDHMLTAGQRYQPRSAGSVVIEALDDACLNIAE